MSGTLLLDRTTWDLCKDATGNIAMATTPYATEQDVASATRTFQGECWYDTSLGVPYWSQILGQQPPLALVKSLVVTEALRVPLVVSARMYVSSFSNRQIQGQIQAKTTSGQIIVIETGALAASVAPVNIASLVAAPVVPPIAPPTQQLASALLAGAGGIIQAFNFTWNVGATLPGSGVLASSVRGPIRISVALGGAGVLTPAPRLQARSQATLAAAAGLSATPAGIPHQFAASAALGGAGALVANAGAHLHIAASALLAGAGSLIAGSATGVPAWNPSDDTGFTLSNSNTTATSTANINTTSAGVRTSNSIGPNLKVYAEFATTTVDATQRFGIATSAWSETTPLGSDLNSVAVLVGSTGVVGSETDITSGPHPEVTSGGQVIGTLAAIPVAGGTLGVAVDTGAQLIWFRVTPSGGPPGLWGAPTSTALLGSQSVGTSGPILGGPSSGVMQSGSAAILGVGVSDTAFPSASVGLVVTTTSGTLTMTAIGGGSLSTIVGSGTQSITMSDNSNNVETSLTTLTFVAGPVGATATIVVKVTDQNAASNQLTIPITVVGVPNPATGQGGISYAAMTPGNIFFATSVGS